MADQPGIARGYIQPQIPDFNIIPPILFGLSDRERVEARIGQLEQKISAMMDYMRQQQPTLDTGNDLNVRRLNEFLVERQETETTIAQWTADQNNLDTGDGISFRVSTDATRSITGLLAGIDGQIKTFINVGSFEVEFPHQSGSSDAANRFLNATGATLLMDPEEQITFWYDITTARWREIERTGAIPSQKIWTFDSPTGSSGTFYFGGFYLFHSAALTPAGGTNVGTANSSYAAHALVVLGATSTDMVVRVTGTSITDGGTRATSATEDIDTSGGVSGAYFETTKKWIGLVSYTLLSGTGVTINAGFAKYWDNNNTIYDLAGLEATWVGGATDTAPNIELLHHKSTGWTYGAGGTPTTPTAIAAMATDHSTEDNVINGEPGAWKRDNLTTEIDGSSSEGIIWRVTTTANKTFELGNFVLRITH
ncbi:hypothetical protein LCGC14_2566660 [marine sediment metagenome]|uniref:Uncharacterized protein n=1 Tax=marine sediment metagenome TaxID=412755 RepID=A0A0F9B6E4_9ZZZZ